MEGPEEQCARFKEFFFFRGPQKRLIYVDALKSFKWQIHDCFRETVSKTDFEMVC